VFTLNGSFLNAGPINGPAPVKPPGPGPGSPLGVVLAGTKGLLSVLVVGEGFMQLQATVFMLMDMVKTLTAGTPVAGALTKAHVALITGSPRYAAGQPLNALTEPSFPGYSRILLDPTKWQPPSVRSDGSVGSVNQTPVTFRMTDGTVPTTITGVALIDTATGTGNILAQGTLDVPVNLLDETMALTLVPVFSLPAVLSIGQVCTCA
jgi:hypothetical protein